LLVLSYYFISRPVQGSTMIQPIKPMYLIYKFL